MPAPPFNDEANRIARAAELWREAVDPRGTLVETYLASRALALADVRQRGDSVSRGVSVDGPCD